MKDVHAVLFQKQQEVERVRHEVQALLVVIPLLANDLSVSDIVPLPGASSAQTFGDPSKKPQKRETFSQLLSSWLAGGEI
jgi:hypothetical protein